MTFVSSAPTSRVSELSHRPELDGIRGLAILGVLSSHSADLLGVLPHTGRHAELADVIRHIMIPGWGGVDLFFALSGFLITRILLKRRGETRYYGTFYMRRVLRIVPIYYLFLISSLLAGHFIAPLHGYLPYGPWQIFSFFIYLQNWPMFWTGFAGIAGIWGVYWSLAVEEQFYLVWPTLIRKVRPLRLLQFCLLAFACGPFARIAVAHHLTGWSLGILHFPTARFDGLFLGAAIALYQETRNQKVPLQDATVAFAAGAAVLAFVAAFHREEFVSTGKYMESFGIAGFALLSFGLIAASQHHLRWLQAALCSPVLTRLGKYSYGIYVYHLAAFALVRSVVLRLLPNNHGELSLTLALLTMALCMLGSYYVAKASFEFIEAPILRLKRFFPQSDSESRLRVAQKASGQASVRLPAGDRESLPTSP